ncbi:unnamed protein product [Rhizoctonia solani]|uniref:Protein kinase domain-containing protein n=1 Tax=Rhizoctonia solani TaxID=456999 RepID=A0A8H3E7I1_9AGAM|nr:unnamed protein product [Rhizoctonia solani]
MASMSNLNQRPAVFNSEGGRLINNSTYTPGSTTLTPWVPSIPQTSGPSSQHTDAKKRYSPSGDRPTSFPMAPRTNASPSNELGGGSSLERPASTNMEALTQPLAALNLQGDSSTSDQIVIAVTHDRASYADIDITNHLGDAQTIRQEIASKITNDPHSRFNISRMVSPGLTTAPLGDDELLVTCLNFGDGRGTLKFCVDLVSRAASDHARTPPLPPTPPTTTSARISMPEPVPWHAEGPSTASGNDPSDHLDSPTGHMSDLDRSGYRYQNPITNIGGNMAMPEHTSPTVQPSEPDPSRFSVPYFEDPAVVTSLRSPSTPPPGRSNIARNTLHSEPNEMSEAELLERPHNEPAPTRRVFDGPRGTISRRMTMDEVLYELYNHGCKNVTPYLNRSMSGNTPVAGGGFGDVYRGALNNGTEVGLKCVRLEADSDDGGRKKVKDAARELYIWSKCKHPNVLELIGVTQHRNLIAMVSPWMDNGDLSRFLHKHPETDRYNLCTQIADGVAYLHQENVVHGDLKGANILVSKDHTPKITDFGTSSRNEYTLKFTETTKSPTMSLRWTAPELIAETTNKNSFETDVFSLGMTMLEVVTGMHPYAGIHDGAVVLRLVTGDYPIRPEAHIPTGNEKADLLWSLLVDCWALKPQDRPTAIQVRDRMESIASM